MFDWQTIIVSLIILAALAYVARRGLRRLHSFRVRTNIASPSCAVGCGCDKGSETKTQTVVKLKPPTISAQLRRER